MRFGIERNAFKVVVSSILPTADGFDKNDQAGNIYKLEPSYVFQPVQCNIALLLN